MRVYVKMPCLECSVVRTWNAKQMKDKNVENVEDVEDVEESEGTMDWESEKWGSERKKERNTIGYNCKDWEKDRICY